MSARRSGVERMQALLPPVARTGPEYASRPRKAVPVSGPYLEMLGREAAQAEAAAAKAQQRRDQHILRAIREGWTQAEAAAATGLSKQRISQIVREARA